jgi:hypothetical protein
MTAITPIRANVYDLAYREALSAGGDWGKMLACARTLANSRNTAHMSLANHIVMSHALHEAGLLHPRDPAARDKSDMIDEWKEAAMAPQDETPADVIVRHAHLWPEILLWAVMIATALLVATGWL